MTTEDINESVDWYEQRHTLAPDQVFEDYDGDLVKLDRRVPGDATRWYVANWYAGNPNFKGYEVGHWSYEDSQIEPSDLVRRSEDPARGEA